MARIKPKRHGVIIDMTAMCDVAFLLLTFFILTTQFKKPDVEQIKPPSSISTTLLPDSSLMTVNVTPKGTFYFQPVDKASERIELLDNMGKKYGITFTEAEKAKFARIPAVGVPMNKLKGFLALSPEAQKEYKDPEGVPQDSVNAQLKDWIDESKKINTNYKLAIKGDVNTKYPKVKSLFEGLRDINFLNFWLITSSEGQNQE